MLLQNNILSIKFFAERVPLFENVNQATNIFVLTKGGSSTSITISEGGETFVVDVALVKELFPKNLEIPIINSNEWEILRKLCEYKGIEIVEANACVDHIHMCIKIPPKYSVAQIMGI